MSSETKPVYKIYYQPEYHIVIMEWNGYATSQEFRQGTELMLSLVIEHKTNKVIADVRHMLMVGLDDQQWMQHDFLPRAIQQGMKACAIIRSTNYFNRVSIETISQVIDPSVMQIQFFDSIPDARNWLNKV